MKALTLFLLRLSTGMLMVWWGLGRAVFRNGSDGGKNVGEALSEAYYKGIANDGNIQIMLGWAEVALGAAVILGVLRIVVYPLQVIVLGLGAFFIWNHILDPYGLFLFEEGKRANLLFFPSSTVFFATLTLMAFKEYDNISVDSILGR